jgi:hypothetical protein
MEVRFTIRFRTAIAGHVEYDSYGRVKKEALMIYEAFVAPKERPNSTLEIKRALLAFDKIHIADPGDRDLFPPQAFMMAMGMPPVMGINTGPVRPLGKARDYDDAFDRLMSDVDIARRQGLIDVVSSYDRSTSDKTTIGAVLLGDYPLNPRFMLWAYRNIGRDADVIKLAIAGDNELFGLSDDEIRSMEVANCSADGGINNDPALPLLEGNLAREDLRTTLSNIARARLGSVIKTIGFCVSKKMIPCFGESSYSALANKIALRANDVIDRVAAEDNFWASRAEVLRVAHEEYIDESILNEMSIDDVVKLRTSVWGKQANAREDMLRSIADLSKELNDKEGLREAARDRIVRYRKIAEELERERSSLKLKIKCDIGMAVAGMATAEGGVVLSQMQTAIGAATTLLAGCAYTLAKIKEYGPVIQQLKAAEAEFKDDAAFGLHNFYARIDEVTKS